MNRWDETWQRLREWTRGQAASERLAAQIVLEGGFENLDPIHPMGGKDDGKDALMEKDGELWIMAVFFPRGQKSCKEIEDKFAADFEDVAKNEAKGMAFVTNQELTESERRDLARAVGGPTEIFHLERVVTILDRPHMAGLRSQYLDIEFGPEGLEPTARLEEMMRASVARCAQRWQAVGLPREEASALAEDLSIGRVHRALSQNASRPVVIWTAKIAPGSRSRPSANTRPRSNSPWRNPMPRSLFSSTRATQWAVLRIVVRRRRRRSGSHGRWGRG